MTQTTTYPNLMIYNALDLIDNALDPHTPAYTYDCKGCTHPEAVEGVFYADMFNTMPEAAIDRKLHIEEYHPDVTVMDHHGREHVVKFNRSVKVFRNGFLQTVKVCESRYDAEQWVTSQHMTTSAYRSTHYQYEIV